MVTALFWGGPVTLDSLIICRLSYCVYANICGFPVNLSATGTSRGRAHLLLSAGDIRELYAMSMQ